MPSAKGAPQIEHAQMTVQAATTISVATQSVDYPILHATTVVARSLSRNVAADGTTGRFKVGKGRWLARAHVRFTSSGGTPTWQLKVYAGVAGSAAEVATSTDQVVTSGTLYVEAIVDITSKGQVIEFRISNETGVEDMAISYAFLTVTGLETEPMAAIRP